jgi:hypothetical protein
LVPKPQRLVINLLSTSSIFIVAFDSFTIVLAHCANYTVVLFPLAFPRAPTWRLNDLTEIIAGERKKIDIALVRESPQAVFARFQRISRSTFAAARPLPRRPPQSTALSDDLETFCTDIEFSN